MNTGNLTVDKIGEINFSGNIVPQTWYATIRKETGKPYLTAIVILSDIVYWYRPTEIRDEGTGLVTGYKKKFCGDKLQRSYQQISDLFGISKKEATNAVIFLEKMGVVKREFRTISINGIICNNVLFIDLIPEKLKEITYPDAECDSSVSENINENTKEVIAIPQKSDRGVPNEREVTAQSEGTNTKTLSETLPKTLPKSLQSDISAEFDILWKRYPRKLGKPKALKSYEKARKNGVTFEQVQRGIEDYCKVIQQNVLSKAKRFNITVAEAKTEVMAYVKHGSTWFGNECWNDEYDIADKGEVENGSTGGNSTEAERPSWSGNWL